jgi:hypothetical protein
MQGKVSGFDRLVSADTLRRLDVRQYLPKMKTLRATAMEPLLAQRHPLQGFPSHYLHGTLSAQ